MPETTRLIDGIIRSGKAGGDFYEPNDSRIIGWLREAVSEGEAINKSDPGFQKADDAMAYITGDQDPTPNEAKPSYVPKFIINRSRKAARTHISAMSDLEPMFGYRSFNPQFQDQGYILDKIVTIWWTNCFVDLEVADALAYSLAAGAGDLLLEYDPHYMGSGDNRLFARDPRDTLPIRPERSRSLQDWEGVTFREEHSVNRLRAYYPEKASILTPDSGLLGAVLTRFKRSRPLQQGTTSTLDGLGKNSPTGKLGKLENIFPTITTYRTFINDRSINLSSEDKLIGAPGAAWSYRVPPGGRLYPQKRLIVWAEQGVLYDGPSPYWHGMYPGIRMTLDSWPWLFAGLGLLHDIMPVQDAINSVVNEIFSVFKQTTARGSIWDSKMPDPMVRRFDARKPNWKVKHNRQLAGEPFRLAEAPQLPPWTQQFVTFLFSQFDDLAETGNIQALLQLRQSPGAETIQKYMEALTPGIRLEARRLSASLRELGTMVKDNVFQFYSVARRLMMLGEQGGTLQDLDYDPDTLIPAMGKGDAGYIPELDAERPRVERAKFFSKQFAFRVAPNSLLAMQATERKLLNLQLARQGYMDYWTLMESLDIPNVGAPPPIPLPAQGGGSATDPLTQQPMVDPTTGMPLPQMEVRVPVTITERLQAQQMLGIGQTVSPAGRKASGQEMPALKQKGDGSTTVSESGT